MRIRNTIGVPAMSPVPLPLNRIDRRSASMQHVVWGNPARAILDLPTQALLDGVQTNVSTRAESPAVLLLTVPYFETSMDYSTSIYRLTFENATTTTNNGGTNQRVATTTLGFMVPLWFVVVSAMTASH